MEKLKGMGRMKDRMKTDSEGCEMEQLESEVSLVVVTQNYNELLNSLFLFSFVFFSMKS
jgi:hypothetical protein